MDKILDFKKGEVLDIPSKYYRFQCDCLASADAMTVGVDGIGKDNEDKYITLEFDLNISFWDRIKFLFKGNWSWRDFIIRQDDMKVLSDIINPEKKYGELL